jgi:hypothetical protein
MNKGMVIMRLKELLPDICDEETSSDPKRWQFDKCLWGHSDVVALLVQELVGGELMKVPLKNLEGFKSLNHHIYNAIEGDQVDMAAEVFGNSVLRFPKARPVTRDKVLANPKAKARYQTFSERYRKHLERAIVVMKRDSFSGSTESDEYFYE